MHAESVCGSVSHGYMRIPPTKKPCHKGFKSWSWWIDSVLGIMGETQYLRKRYKPCRTGFRSWSWWADYVCMPCRMYAVRSAGAGLGEGVTSFFTSPGFLSAMGFDRIFLPLLEQWASQLAVSTMSPGAQIPTRTQSLNTQQTAAPLSQCTRPENVSMSLSDAASSLEGEELPYIPRQSSVFAFTPAVQQDQDRVRMGRPLDLRGCKATKENLALLLERCWEGVDVGILDEIRHGHFVPPPSHSSGRVVATGTCYI